MIDFSRADSSSAESPRGSLTPEPLAFGFWELEACDFEAEGEGAGGFEEVFWAAGAAGFAGGAAAFALVGSARGVSLGFALSAPGFEDGP